MISIRYAFICSLATLSGIAEASPIVLTCVRQNESGKIFSVEFDEVKKNVRTVFGESYADTDKTKIVFTATTTEGVSYLFIIHRATGQMELWNENTKTQLTPYTCNLVKPKF